MSTPRKYTAQRPIVSTGWQACTYYSTAIRRSLAAAGYTVQPGKVINKTGAGRQLRRVIAKTVQP